MTSQKTGRTVDGQVKLVIFDWAGTTVDFGCQAPTVAFREIFANQGVPISVAQARGPMGLTKRAHIQAVCRMPEVASAWQARHGQAATEQDMDRMYAEFQPRLLEVLPHYARLIPGTIDVVHGLQARGVMIGSTTGYFLEALERLLEEAAKQGYVPDSSICATQVPAGRPAPWMIFETMRNTGVYPPQAVVKVGDTVPDIEAGLNAGAWTVGVALTGNEMGLSQDELEALDQATRERMADAARARLAESGAHIVLDSIEQVLPALAEIESRLAHGERP